MWYQMLACQHFSCLSLTEHKGLIVSYRFQFRGASIWICKYTAFFILQYHIITDAMHSSYTMVEIHLHAYICTLLGVVAHWYSRCLSTGRSRIQIPLQLPCRCLGQVLHLQLPVALRQVNSDTVSIAVVGSVSERLML